MNFKKVYKYTKDLHVLYVEDDEHLLEETYDVLEDYFTSVDTAVDGKIALEKYENYFESHGKHYDLVITDINMPVMDGEALIEAIHTINIDQSIIVVSAYNESSRLLSLIQKGITNFALKPLVPSQFMKMLYVTAKTIVAHNNEHIYKQKLEHLNQNLDKKVQELSQELLFTQQVSVQAIANMVESYDDETGSHVKRIEHYTLLMLNGLPTSDECPKSLKESVPFASILHDIGKLMIPKHILIKPAKLDYDEFEIIKTHAKLGGEVLKKANLAFRDHYNKDSYLKVASDIAMYHHERWDGSGYPEGLKGRAIPKCARIVAIVDVYDALRCKRVYKDGYSHDKAVDIIKNGSAKNFDPELVAIFLELHKEFEGIFSKFS